MRNTKAERTARFYASMASLGFTYEEADKLRLIELTLQRWAERECGTDNGCIERDETTGKPYWLNSHSMRRTPVADREKGALKRLEAIVGARNERYFYRNRKSFKDALTPYHQNDPRGCALYLVRSRDIKPGESIDSVYTRGFAVCI